MDILLTFTGFHDPYFKGLIDQEEQPGPILSLLAARFFEHIFLFDTPSTQRVTRETKDAISKLHQKSAVHILEIPLDDPTDYQEIFKGVRSHVKTINAGIFARLRDPVLFAQAYVEYGAVGWPGEVDLAPDAIYDEIKKHGRWVPE